MKLLSAAFGFSLLVVATICCRMLTTKPNPKLEQAASASSTGLRVLFIGNSFTYYNDMPQMFADLVRKRSPSVCVDAVAKTAGGYKLSQFARDPETLDLISKNGPWDYIVLQEQSGMPLDPSSITAMRESCIYLSKLTASARAKTVLFMTWSDSNKLAEQPTISKTYRDLGRDIGALVIPAGDLFVSFTRQNSSVNLYDPDNHHPSKYGSYLVACLFRDMLTETKNQINQYRGAPTTGTSSDLTERLLERYADDFALSQ